MLETSLLKRIEGLELWSIVNDSAQHFAVKTSDGRVRVVQTIERAEEFLTKKLLHARAARAH